MDNKVKISQEFRENVVLLACAINEYYELGGDRSVWMSIVPARIRVEFPEGLREYSAAEFHKNFIRPKKTAFLAAARKEQVRKNEVEVNSPPRPEVAKLLTIDQVAHLLQVSPKTIRNWTSARQIPFVKLNRVIRFSETEILNFISTKAKAS